MVEVIKIDKETGHQEFICENADELDTIPHKETLFGCIAYCLEDKKFYIMNSNSEWEVQ